MPNKSGEKEKIVLAYSGGLDTSIIIPWLKKTMLRSDRMVADVGRETTSKPSSARRTRPEPAK